MRRKRMIAVGTAAGGQVTVSFGDHTWLLTPATARNVAEQLLDAADEQAPLEAEARRCDDYDMVADVEALLGRFL